MFRKNDMKNQKDNIEKIFDSESNIDVDLILGYIDNTLTQPELHKIEKALISDPFLSEAIEGLRLLPDNDRKLFIYNLLGKEPSKKLNIEIHPMAWKIAAVTIVAISSIYFISTIDFNSTSESLAHQEIATEETPAEESSSTKSVQKPINNTPIAIENNDSLIHNDLADIVAEANNEENEEDIESATLITKKEINKDVEITLLETESLDLNEPSPVAEEERLINTGSVSRSANSNEKAGDTYFESKAKKTTAPRSNDQIAKGMIETLKRKGIVEASHSTSEDQSNLSKKEAKALASYDEGLDAYNRGNYHASVKRFEEAYKQNKSLPEVRYYLSTSYLYGNNNIGKAEKVFKDESTGKYTQEKQWVKALIELGEGKTKNAKEILQQISKSGSKFKSEADKLLLEIE